MHALLALFLAGCGPSSSSTDDPNGGPTTTVGGEEVRPPETIVYVTPTGSGGGSSWDDAFGDIQAAINRAADEDEAWVWVAEGTYTPTSGKDREASFVLRPGVSVFGGFAGDEELLGERDFVAHPTVLSGDIGERDNYRDNSFHVVVGADDAALDGFIVEKGYAFPVGGYTPDGDVTDIIETDTPDAELLRILEGIEVLAGAGMYNVKAAPTVRNTTFRDNHAGKGGAVYNMVSREFPLDGDPYPAAHFEDVVFEANTAANRGGAINNDLFTSPTFVDVEFRDNACDEKGGAIYNDMGSSPGLVNVLFAGNSAERGGALGSDGTSSPELVYVTIVDNTADDLGAALYQGTYTPNSDRASRSNANEPTLTASIVVANDTRSSPSSLSNWHDSSLVTDDASLVEMFDGDTDPAALFVDYAGGNYTTTDADLGWDPDRDLTDATDLLGQSSPEDYPAYPYDTESGGSGGVIYVDRSAAGGGNGGSWNQAYRRLEDALGAAGPGSEIRIADGTYTPTDTSDREASFVIPQGVTVLGGFCGGEQGTGNRDIEGCPAILSGEIGGGGRSDNSYHVVVGAKGATLDGVTITGGYADGRWYHSRGGGLLAYHEANITLRDVTFTDNYAVDGGALAAYDNSDLILEGCQFEGNEARWGGAALFRYGSDGQVSDTTFRDNLASARGGAVLVDYGSNIVFNGGSFVDNTSNGNGGAVYVDDNESQFGQTVPAFNGTQFDGNSTASRGGALATYNSGTRVTLDGAVLRYNEAVHGGGAVAVDFHSTVNAQATQLNNNTSSSGEDDVDVEEGAVFND